MSDLISRQDAIDAIDQYGSVWMEYTDRMSIEEIAERALKASKQSMIKILHDLPSAERVGRWVWVKGSNGKDYHKCSECLHTQEITGVKNYCAVCGARMVSE